MRKSIMPFIREIKVQKKNCKKFIIKEHIFWISKRARINFFRTFGRTKKDQKEKVHE
jgi:hypothetical protein